MKKTGRGAMPATTAIGRMARKSTPYMSLIMTSIGVRKKPGAFVRAWNSGAMISLRSAKLLSETTALMSVSPAAASSEDTAPSENPSTPMRSYPRPFR